MQIDVMGMLRVMFTPGCWIQNHKYDKEYDEWLTNSMLTHQFVEVGPYDAWLNGRTIWIENHPYASFVYKDMRPKRITLLRAMDKLTLENT